MGLQQAVVGQEAADGGAVVAGAEGGAGLDPEVHRVDRGAAKIVHAIDEEAAGADRRQARERHGQPVGVSQHLGDGDQLPECAEHPAEGLGLAVIAGEAVDPPAAGVLVLLEDGIGGALQFEIGVDGRRGGLGLGLGSAGDDLDGGLAHGASLDGAPSSANPPGKAKARRPWRRRALQASGRGDQ